MLGKTNSSSGSNDFKVTNGTKISLPSSDGNVIDPYTFIKVTNGPINEYSSNLITTVYNNELSNSIGIIELSGNRLFVYAGQRTNLNASKTVCKVVQINDDYSITEGTNLNLFEVSKNQSYTVNAVLLSDDKILLQSDQYGGSGFYSKMVGVVLTIDNLSITASSPQDMTESFMCHVDYYLKANLVRIDENTAVTIYIYGPGEQEVKAVIHKISNTQIINGTAISVFKSPVNMDKVVSNIRSCMVNNNQIVIFMCGEYGIDTYNQARIISANENSVVVGNSSSMSLVSTMYNQFSTCFTYNGNTAMFFGNGKCATVQVSSSGDILYTNITNLQNIINNGAYMTKDGYIYAISKSSTNLTKWKYESNSFNLVYQLKVLNKSANGLIIIHDSRCIAYWQDYSDNYGQYQTSYKWTAALPQCVTPTTSGIQGITSEKVSTISGICYLGN